MELNWYLLDIYAVLDRSKVFAIDLAQGLKFCSEDRDIKVVLDIFVSELLQNKDHGNKQAFFRNGFYYLTLKTYFCWLWMLSFKEVRRCSYRFCLTV